MYVMCMMYLKTYLSEPRYYENWMTQLMDFIPYRVKYTQRGTKLKRIFQAKVD